MARYSSIPVITTQDNPKRRFINVKYPDIPRDFADTYIYTTQSDRYDLLAQTYYNNSSLWWVISRANPTQPFDSMYPGIGVQIRIPSSSRIPTILGTFENLNRI